MFNLERANMSQLQFTTTAQQNAASGVKVLCYAPAGTGKTVLCATAPAPLILSAEAGLLSLSRKNLERIFGVNTPGICYDIPVIQIKTVEDLNAALLFCQSAQANQIQTVCLDSISEIAETVLNNAKRQVKDPRQAYGELIEKMESVIRAFRDLPNKNVFMAAKLEPMKDELTGAIKYGASMPGAKLGHKIPYFFDEVFRLGVGKDQASGQSYRFLQTQPDLQYDAKDRSGALAAVETPHLGYIFNKILTGA
jgi:hypothetical protein